MAISKAMRAALRAISYIGSDVKKTYRLRRALDSIGSGFYAYPPEYKIWDHEVRSNDQLVPVRIFTPPVDTQRRSIVFFHGGGWVTGNIDTYGRTCVELAEHTSRTVISVDYRLAPEHPFPAALNDCYAVVKEIMVSDDIEFDKSQIVLAGDSAGGNLAAAVSLMSRDRGEFSVPAQILIYPSTAAEHENCELYPSLRENGTDFLLTVKMVNDYLALYRSSDDDLKNPYYAPLVASDFSNQPKTLIISGEYCPLRDEGEAYGEKLLEAGVDVTVCRVPDGLHGFFSLPSWYEPVQQAYKAITDFLGGLSNAE